MAQQLSLLTLPLDIRILIYELVLTPDLFNFADPTYTFHDQTCSPMQNIKAFNIVSIGTAPHRNPVDINRLVHQRHDPWVLARICQQIKFETAWLLAAVSLDDVFFSFHGFTPQDMSAWVERVGVGAVKKIRCLGIDSVNWCHDWYRWTERNPRNWELAPSCLRLHRGPHKEQIQCYRALYVNLAAAHTKLQERDNLVQLDAHTDDAHTKCHYDHHTGAQNPATHLHRELVGVQCSLELRQGCLDAIEQFTTENDNSSAQRAGCVATIDGLTTLVMAVRGRERYADERLQNKFPRRRSCEGTRDI